MFRFTQIVIVLAAVLLVSGTFLLSVTSIIWNLIALPLILCGLGLILAICEYQQAKLEQENVRVYCLLKRLNQNKASNHFKDVA